MAETDPKTHAAEAQQPPSPLLPSDDPFSSMMERFDEAAQMLGVSTNIANSALRLLAQRRIIERKQRTGSVIAHPPDREAAPVFRRTRPEPTAPRGRSCRTAGQPRSLFSHLTSL